LMLNVLPLGSASFTARAIFRRGISIGFVFVAVMV
jgi:hypothetical protein